MPQRIVGMLSLPDPSSFQEVTPVIVPQLGQRCSTCEDMLLGQDPMSDTELDTENGFVRSRSFYFPIAGAEPEAFMLHFLNTSKTDWGCSQIRQTVGLVPVPLG